jgi:bifunctional DNA-binding transcriptional regulator/antitoxin component of YhaV-PrlF toxin-antitoxin module
MQVLMSLESKVGIAKTGTKSLRATVPEGIVAFLGINEGDKLEWRMDIQKNERVAIVRKKRS